MATVIPARRRSLDGKGYDYFSRSDSRSSPLSIWAMLVFIPSLWLLIRQIRVLDIDDPALCLRLFKANREFGLAIGLAIVLGRL